MSNYLVQVKHTWETEWTTVFPKNFARTGHLTWLGAKIHQMHWEAKHRQANMTDLVETRIVSR